MTIGVTRGCTHHWVHVHPPGRRKSVGVIYGGKLQVHPRQSKKFEVLQRCYINKINKILLGGRDLDGRSG